MIEIFSTQTLIINGLFALVMITLAFKDYSSAKTENHQDYKSIIISIGVLGTFFGIFLGLIGFDTTNIKDSVPILLEGLKTAFITSIFGMFISIFLSIIQKVKGHADLEDEFQIMSSMNTHLEKLSVLGSIDERLRQLETLPLMNTKLDSMDTNIKTLSQDISSVKEQMSSDQKILFEFLETSLDKVNKSLEDAIDTLAEGATEEIIKALENVIQDFNKNLTEQFGDNFKQLNESVKNMIVWQENYKNSITDSEKRLEIAMHNASEFSKEMNNSIKENFKQNKLESEKVQKITEVLLEKIETAISTSNDNVKVIKQITDDYENINELSKKLQSIITTNDNQINNLEIHLKAFAEVSDASKGIVEQLKVFSDQIQTTLSNQSEVLSTLTTELENQLPKSLDTLNKSLTSLTKQFSSDYETFLDQISKLMRTNNL